MSLFGTRLTEFALAVWLYQKTESITQFAFIFLFIYLPNIVMSPIAGAMVDRWNRRWAMILSDAVAGIGTLVILALTLANQLQLWHVYVGVTVFSIFNTFQGPAYAAAVTQLVPPQDYGRANGMVQVARGMTKVISPAIAGYLIGIIQLQGILVIDWCTFIFALITLLIIRIPDLKRIRTRPSAIQLAPARSGFRVALHHSTAQLVSITVLCGPDLFHPWHVGSDVVALDFGLCF